MTQLPTPTKSDLRTAVRVDYFTAEPEAAAFYAAKAAEGFNAHLTKPVIEGPYAGLHGVWWADRPESWYYTGPFKGGVVA